MRNSFSASGLLGDAQIRSRLRVCFGRTIQGLLDIGGQGYVRRGAAQVKIICFRKGIVKGGLALVCV